MERGGRKGSVPEERRAPCEKGHTQLKERWSALHRNLPINIVTYIFVLPAVHLYGHVGEPTIESKKFFDGIPEHQPFRTQRALDTTSDSSRSTTQRPAGIHT